MNAETRTFLNSDFYSNYPSRNVKLSVDSVGCEESVDDGSDNGSTWEIVRRISAGDAISHGSC